MSEKQISARTQQKIDLTANWEKATNFVPKKGEIIVYSDGGGTGVPKMKVGDGTTKVGSLKFITVDSNASLSINGKSYNGSTAVDIGTIGAEYGGSGKTTLSASANVFLNSLPYGSTAETTLTDDHNFYMNSLTGQTNYKVPMSSVYTYVKGKLDSVYLSLSGGTMTGALGIGENMSITEVDTSTKHSLVFYPTAVGSNDGNKRVAFVYDPTSGELQVMAPKFQGQFIGTASQASKVINALTINGTSYNGSTAVDLTIGGGATITLKTWTDADVA